MPYLPATRKQALDEGAAPQTVGDLTYVFTREAVRYLGERPDFARHAEVIAALEAAKVEFYRRALAPYEDQAIARNGDVFSPSPWL